MSFGLLATATIPQEVIVGSGPPPVASDRYIKGLTFLDTFDRADGPLGGTLPDSGSLGMEWDAFYAESGQSIQIVSNRIKVGSPGGAVVQISASYGDRTIMQVTYKMGTQALDTFGGYGLRRTAWPVGADQRYTSDWNNNANNFTLRQTDTGGSTNNGQAISIPDNSFFHNRLIVDGPEGSEVLAVYAEEVGSLDDRDDDLTLLQELTASRHPDFAGSGPIIRLTLFRSSEADYMFICGLDIEVTNLPSGFKARALGPITSRSAVVESAGTASMRVNSWALPITSIEILNGADVSQEVITPVDGVFGGDKYNFGG